MIAIDKNSLRVTLVDHLKYTLLWGVLYFSVYYGFIIYSVCSGCASLYIFTIIIMWSVSCLSMVALIYSKYAIFYLLTWMCYLIIFALWFVFTSALWISVICGVEVSIVSLWYLGFWILYAIYVLFFNAPDLWIKNVKRLKYDLNKCVYYANKTYYSKKKEPSWIMPGVLFGVVIASLLRLVGVHFKALIVVVLSIPITGLFLWMALCGYFYPIVRLIHLKIVENKNVLVSFDG